MFISPHFFYNKIIDIHVNKILKKYDNFYITIDLHTYIYMNS